MPITAWTNFLSAQWHQWRSQVHIFGGTKKSEARGRRGKMVVSGIEVPYVMKENRRIGIRGRAPGNFFRSHPLNNREAPFLYINICPFLDGKEQLHYLFQCYLPMYRFYCRIERFSNTNFFITGVGRPPTLPSGHASDWR